jgi:DNA-binding NarL/FixJ family response regulator
MAARVLLADDHPLFRDGVAALLQARGFEVVGEASDGLEALELARQLHPDLVLMDIHMPRLNGLDATRVMSAELTGTRVVMLTVSDDDADLFEAIKSGAQGYVLKNTDTRTFFELLNGAAQGEAPISRRLAGKILNEFARRASEEKKPAQGPEELSEREKEVLRFVAEGLTNRDIGARLSLSENTIKYHLKNILQKLHMRNRAQAVAFALQSGFLRPKKT